MDVPKARPPPENFRGRPLEPILRLSSSVSPYSPPFHPKSFTHCGMNPVSLIASIATLASATNCTVTALGRICDLRSHPEYLEMAMDDVSNDPSIYQVFSTLTYLR